MPKFLPKFQFKRITIKILSILFNSVQYAKSLHIKALKNENNSTKNKKIKLHFQLNLSDLMRTEVS